MKLSRMQVATVKQMAKNLKPLEVRIEKLNQKKLEIDAEVIMLEAQAASINVSIESFTGGLTLTEVLNPEAVVTEMSDMASIDETAVADETDVTEMLADSLEGEPISNIQYPNFD